MKNEANQPKPVLTFVSDPSVLLELKNIKDRLTELEKQLEFFTGVQETEQKR